MLRHKKSMKIPKW